MNPVHRSNKLTQNRFPQLSKRVRPMILMYMLTLAFSLLWKAPPDRLAVVVCDGPAAELARSWPSGVWPVVLVVAAAEDVATNRDNVGDLRVGTDPSFSLNLA